MPDMSDKKEYEDIPVYYCKRCLSLAIKGEDDLEYCDDCGCTDIDCALMDDWDELYYKRFGRYFTNYGRKDKNK